MVCGKSFMLNVGAHLLFVIFDFAQLLQNTRHTQITHFSVTWSFSTSKIQQSTSETMPSPHCSSTHHQNTVTTFESSSISSAPGFSCFSELEKLTLCFCCCCFASWPLSSVRATPLGAGTKISVVCWAVLAGLSNSMYWDRNVSLELSHLSWISKLSQQTILASQEYAA